MCFLLLVISDSALLPFFATGGGRKTTPTIKQLNSYKIKTTRPTGGLLQGYKPMLPASASRRWLSLCSSLLPLPLSPPLKGCLYYSPPLKGPSYSRTLNLSSAISCFSWSSMYFLMVASFRPTVLT